MIVPTRSTAEPPVRLLALALLVLAALAPAVVEAAVPEKEILGDSIIELKESATSGAYRELAVTLATRDGQSTLVVVKDGAETRIALPVEASLALWKTVLALGAVELTDASPKRLPPDHSRFTVTIRTGSVDHTVTAAGVDDLADTRYRAIVREILHLADSRAYGKAWRK